jgi:ABC-type sugar transport system ATPase subunit
VTHDQVEAMTLADRIVILNNGRVEQEGPPLALYERPANRFVAGFLGQPKMNFLPALAVGTAAGFDLRLDAEGPTVLSLSPDTGLRPGDAVEIGIRPDAITLAEGSGLRATVVLVERLGGSSLLHARVEGLAELMTVELAGTYQAPAGTPIRLRIDPDRVHVFASDGRNTAT